MPQLPSHFINQIICGDALETVRKLPNDSIDLIVTDPPYGNKGRYGTQYRRIEGDDHPLLGLAVIAACFRVLKRHTSVYMFCGALHLPLIQTFFARYTKYTIRDVLIWNKKHWGLNGYGFAKQYEAVLVLEKGRPRYRHKVLPNLFSVGRVRTPDHPHAKPTRLLKTFITHSSDPGDMVLDPFAGSGMTLLAAQKTGRNYLGIELEKQYCEVAQRNLSHNQ